MKQFEQLIMNHLDMDILKYYNALYDYLIDEAESFDESSKVSFT